MGRQVYNDLIRNLFRRPMSFFDTTPVGQILNRCESDIESYDSELPFILIEFISMVLNFGLTLTVSMLAMPITS